MVGFVCRQAMMLFDEMKAGSDLCASNSQPAYSTARRWQQELTNIDQQHRNRPSSQMKTTEEKDPPTVPLRRAAGGEVGNVVVQLLMCDTDELYMKYWLMN